MAASCRNGRNGPNAISSRPPTHTAGVINGDDPEAPYFAAQCPNPLLYSIHAEADFVAVAVLVVALRGLRALVGPLAAHVAEVVKVDRPIPPDEGQLSVRADAAPAAASVGADTPVLTAGW